MGLINTSMEPTGPPRSPRCESTSSTQYDHDVRELLFLACGDARSLPRAGGREVNEREDDRGYGDDRVWI